MSSHNINVSNFNSKQTHYKVKDNTTNPNGIIDKNDSILNLSNQQQVTFASEEFQSVLRGYSRIHEKAVLASDTNEKLEKSWVDRYVAGKDNIRLHYVTTPATHIDEKSITNTERPLALLLHGFPSNWTSWRGQIDCLEKLGYNVVALDLPGYNASENLPAVRDYNLPNLAEHIKTVVQNLGYKTTTIIGHDWGSGVGEAFTNMYPEMVDKAVFMAIPHPQAMHDLILDDELKRYHTLVEWFTWEGPKAMVFGALYKTPFLFSQSYADSRDKDITSLTKKWARKPFSPIDGFAYYKANLDWMGINENEDIASIPYPKLDVPVLRLYGSDDKILGPILNLPQEVSTDQSHYTNLTRKSVPGGHWINEQSVDEVNAALKDFLKP